MPNTLVAPPVQRICCYFCENHCNETEMRYTPDCRLMCLTCWVRQYFYCVVCGECEWRHSGHRSLSGGGYICYNCRPNPETWDCKPMDVSIATYASIGSKRKFGIELETSRCDNYRNVKGRTYFGAKYDYSVTGMEFFSPILYGDEGLAEVDKLIEFAEGEDFEVNEDCGYHLHVDVRDETPVQLRHIAYAYAKAYPAWRGLVSAFRARESHYCHTPSYSAQSIKECRRIVDFCNGTDRYNYFNLAAYDRHKTFEVRIHDGTLHAKTIQYWVMAHTRFVDAVKDMTYNQIDELLAGSARKQFAALCLIWDNASGQRISEFYQRRFRVHSASRYEDDECDD